MNKIKFEVLFNYLDKVIVWAFNEKEAEILAQAERIKEGKSYERVTSFLRVT